MSQETSDVAIQAAIGPITPKNTTDAAVQVAGVPASHAMLGLMIITTNNTFMLAMLAIFRIIIFSINCSTCMKEQTKDTLILRILRNLIFKDQLESHPDLILSQLQSGLAEISSKFIKPNIVM